MTVNGITENYKGYKIEVDIDEFGWYYWIEDSQGNLIGEAGFHDSADSAFETAYSVIDERGNSD